MQEAATEETFLTVKDLAARHKVTVWTVYAWNHRGTGPKYIKVGDQKSHGLRYRLSDVVAWELTRMRGGDAA